MIEIDGVLISDEIVQEHFLCDLNKCKGGCCVEGDAGAPITAQEAEQIAQIYPHIKERLLPRSVDLIEAEGTHTTDEEFGLVTPTLDTGICAYGYYDEQSIVKCALEAYYYENDTDWKKPISCHLFPIRVTKNEEFEALNYEPRPKLCAPACKLGAALKIPVYQFLKEPLIRSYGLAFYDALHQVAVDYFGVKK